MLIEIEGSARVRLEDGTLLRLNYDAHNGYNRTGVERVLIQRTLIPREEMSLDRIKQWMAAHPEEAKEVRATNRSYVFFRVTGLNNEDEPAGAQGVSLHPGRSIAVDRTHVFGTPFFIEADLPTTTGSPNTKFRRLMIAQDTGSAIVGPARADIYWGAGDDAGRIAGRTRQQGRLVILLPRELDKIAAGKAMPLPQPKPAILHEMVARKEDGDQAHAYHKDRAKPQTEKTDKAPTRNAQQAEGHKKSLSNLRQQAEPASKDTARFRSHELVANKGDGDRARGYRQYRTKLAEMTEAEKAASGHAQKAGDHKNSLVDQRQQEQPASKGAKPRSRQAVASKEDEDPAHGHRKDRATSPAEKAQAEKVRTVKAEKAEDHKKSLSNLRQPTHPAGKGTANPRS
jgi:hypothetical protein